MGGPDDSARQVNVRIPPYLNKPKASKWNSARRSSRASRLTIYAEITLAFQELEWKQRYRLQHANQNPHTSPFRVERSKLIWDRNRYGNVQPWHASRVKLKTPIGGSDYVNASPITLKSRTKKPNSGTSTPVPSDQSSSVITRAETRYIATQGPKEGQFSHFWHMVMQETPGEVGVVVMLTQHVEGHKEKCAQYYPVGMENPTLILPVHEDGNDVGEPGPTDNGDPFLDSPVGSADTDSVGADSEASQPSDVIDEGEKAQEQRTQDSVTLISSEYDSNTGCEVRKLRLTIDEESKTVYHYYFGGWPDFAKPEADDRAALLELTRVSKAMAGDAPRIVHCSAGVGRTGTWIALDFLLQELEAGRLVESSPSRSPTPTPPHNTPAAKSNGTWGRNGPPKATTPDPKDEEDIIFDTVNTLREQRMMMVMNELQYQFIYEVLKEAFIEKYAEKETGPIVIEVQEPTPKVARKNSRSVSGGPSQGTPAGVYKDEEERADSEAETEVMEQDKGEADVDIDESSNDEKGQVEESEEKAPAAADEDPYSAVAPETIREGQQKTEQSEGEVREHELK